MKELNDEIKLTLDLMQCDIDDGAHSELRYHLACLMGIKRERLVTETGLQAELERERERRFEGNRIASAEHRDELECLVSDLQKFADWELPSTDGASKRWRALCEAQRIAESVIAQHRKKPVTHEARPLTADELKGGAWWCGDTSEDCRLALISYGIYTGSWIDKSRPKFIYKLGHESRIQRAHVPVATARLKQIHRIGNDFYWGEKCCRP